MDPMKTIDLLLRQLEATLASWISANQSLLLGLLGALALGLLAWLLIDLWPLALGLLLRRIGHAGALEASLERATARALYRALLPLYQLSIDELDRAHEDLHRLQVDQLAREVYALLPDTILVRFGRLVVPVPIKAIASEADFVALAESALHEADAGLERLAQRLQQQFAQAQQRGVDRQLMLAAAHRLP